MIREIEETFIPTETPLEYVKTSVVVLAIIGIQPGAVIIRSNITYYCVQLCSNRGKI